MNEGGLFTVTILIILAALLIPSNRLIVTVHVPMSVIRGFIVNTGEGPYVIDAVYRHVVVTLTTIGSLSASDTTGSKYVKVWPEESY